jgi:hypothetical protein
VTDQNGPQSGRSGRHHLDPDDVTDAAADGAVYDPNPNTAFDDDFAYTGGDDAAGAAGAGAAGAAGATAGGAGDNGLTPEMEREKPAGGAPLRGLAMILTAVAVVLIAWGIYSFVGGDDDDKSDETVAGQNGSGDGDGAGAGADGADGGAGADSGGGADSADGADGADSENNADSANGADGSNGTDGAAEGGDSADDAGSADGAQNAEGSDDSDDAAGAGDIDRAGTSVTVLNNSNEALAQGAADRLRDEQWSDTGYGNLQGRVTGLSEETRVYYPEGNADAQAAAEQIGNDLGIPAAAGNPDYYDRFGEADVRNGPDADNVVVVLTGPLP